MAANHYYLVLFDAADETGTFFLPIRVAAASEQEASERAWIEIARLGIEKAVIDEIELVEPDELPLSLGGIEVLGRSYYRE